MSEGQPEMSLATCSVVLRSSFDAAKTKPKEGARPCKDDIAARVASLAETIAPTLLDAPVPTIVDMRPPSRAHAERKPPVARGLPYAAGVRPNQPQRRRLCEVEGM